jgi:hypothetical protein
MLAIVILLLSRSFGKTEIELFGHDEPYPMVILLATLSPPPAPLAGGEGDRVWGTRKRKK